MFTALLGSHGDVQLTTENVLKEELVKLDFGPYIHPLPMITYDGEWYKKMVKHLDDSIKRFHDRRILVLSWILAAFIGIFGNLFASSLYGRSGYEPSGFAPFFFVAVVIAASTLLFYFPPTFQHTFQVFFSAYAVDAKHKIFQEFEQKRGIKLNGCSANYIHDNRVGHATKTTAYTKGAGTNYWSENYLDGSGSTLYDGS